MEEGNAGVAIARSARRAAVLNLRPTGVAVNEQRSGVGSERWINVSRVLVASDRVPRERECECECAVSSRRVVLCLDRSCKRLLLLLLLYFCLILLRSASPFSFLFWSVVRKTVRFSDGGSTFVSAFVLGIEVRL